MSLNYIAEKYKIKLIIIFGSFGTKRFGKNSDIDIAFYPSKTLTLEDTDELLTDFITHFGKDNLHLIDLKKANPLLMYEVACTGKPVYEENDSFLKFKLLASARYADTKHLRDKRKEYLNQKINEFAQ